MTDEFYHKDIFGTVVNINLGVVREESELLDQKTRPTEHGSRSGGGREFNIFALTDALGARQRKEAWILYQKALSLGLSAEEIFFKIVWQVKSMLIASKTKNVGETDMKMFPYSKAKSFLKNFKSGELEKLSESLAIGYHRARRGEAEIETLVEKLLLSL
ncbi:MAG: hypothetical protein Q8Q22_02240 [bacterium]|nr:hypothetical protein [bacterium]